MGDEVRIRTCGLAGRITLARPQALNALGGAMVAAIDAALATWADDPAVAVVVIDAEGTRAFCAGGDIADIHRMGREGRFDDAVRYWRDEYVMNRRIAEYPKPVVAFMQGFVMGGGVGLACHASHRIVGDSTRISMPECGIGLVPDVGGTHLLAQAPGALGEYLGLSGARMDAADAIHAGFADRFIPEADWPALIATLEAQGDPACLPDPPAPPSGLAAQAGLIGAVFSAPDMAAILSALALAHGDIATRARAEIGRGAPLSLVVTLALIRAARAEPGVAPALEREFRFTARALRQADFLEGVRAQIIDKDRTPRWRHRDCAAVPAAEVQAMMAPLGPEWTLWTH